MTSSYCTGLSSSTLPGEEERAIYSLGCFLISRTNESRIPPDFCPLSPNMSPLQDLLFPSTSLSSLLHIHLCSTIATHTSWCFSPSLPSSLGSSGHSFGCSACCPLWFPTCAVLILPHNLSLFSFGFLYSQLFPPFLCLLHSPTAQEGPEALVGLG